MKRKLGDIHIMLYFIFFIKYYHFSNWNLFSFCLLFWWITEVHLIINSNISNILGLITFMWILLHIYAVVFNTNVIIVLKIWSNYIYMSFNYIHTCSNIEYILTLWWLLAHIGQKKNYFSFLFGHNIISNDLIYVIKNNNIDQKDNWTRSPFS